MMITPINFSFEEIEILNASSVPIDDKSRYTFKAEFLDNQKRIPIGKEDKAYTYLKEGLIHATLVGGCGAIIGGALGGTGGGAVGPGGAGLGALKGAVYGAGLGSFIGLGVGCLEARIVSIEAKDNEYNYWLVTHKLMPVLVKYAQILSGKVLSPACSIGGTPFLHPVRGLNEKGKTAKLQEGEDLTSEELKSTVFDFVYFQCLIEKTNDIFTKAIIDTVNEQDQMNINLLRLAITGFNNSGGARQIIDAWYKSQEYGTYRTSGDIDLVKEQAWEAKTKIFNRLKKQSKAEVKYINKDSSNIEIKLKENQDEISVYLYS